MTGSSSVLAPPDREDDQADLFGAGAERLPQSKKLTLIRFMQDLHDAEIPSSPEPPRFHTGRLPNSKTGDGGDGKPRLLLMGQRR